MKRDRSYHQTAFQDLGLRANPSLSGDETHPETQCQTEWGAMDVGEEVLWSCEA